MRRGSAPDQLAYSFTDLMTSLMVIFILLLLVFVNNQASVTSVTAQDLTAELRKRLEPAGFKREDIRVDPKDPSTILLTVLDDQLTFQPNSYQLQSAGEQFLQSKMPRLAETLCSEKYRGAIDAVLFEGHSDSVPYRGATLAESQARNLKLSQERSMEVVEKTLTSLHDRPELRACLLEKVSASGRGEQDLADTAIRSRRTVIKVRVNANHAVGLANSIGEGKAPISDRVPTPDPDAVKVLELLSKLQTVPPKPVQFQLTDDEVNRYLIYALLRTPRPGIHSIAVKFFPHNYISTIIEIDFDAIDRWSPGLVPGFLDLNGKRALWIDLRFSVAEGTVSYSLEKALYQNKVLPRFLAEKIVQTLGAGQPENVGGAQIPLPFGLRWIQTGEHYIEGKN